MLLVTITKAHQNEGIFPTFIKGTEVTIKQPCREFADWYLCDIQGYTTYISKYLLKENKLAIDYNPTELDIGIGETVKIIAIYSAWLYAKEIKKQQYGWIPAEKVTNLIIYPNDLQSYKITN